jgi:hypothetical protein
MPTAQRIKYGEFPFDIFAAASLADLRRIGLAHRANGFEFLVTVKTDVFVDWHHPLLTGICGAGWHPALRYLFNSSTVLSITPRTPLSVAFGKLLK